MPEIIVCGHLCIDLIPGMAHVTQTEMVTPGHLSETGPMIVSTGGAVSNTGLSLHRLGVDVGMMANVGDDLIGQMIVGYLNGRDPRLTRDLCVQPGQASSYTVVLSPQNADRMFLHCPGTNDQFGAADVDYARAGEAKIFHFGYPPLMARLYADGGRELVQLLRQVHETGVTTSLDLALPDAVMPSGSAPWADILANALRYVDVFVPSIEEILYMLRPQDYERWRGDVTAHLTRAYLRSLAGDLLHMGAAVAGFKLGDKGLFLRSCFDRKRLARMSLDVSAWSGAEVYQPAFDVEVAGTTGAGDSAYAGLLSAMLRGFGPEETARWACAVGACNVEHPDSNSGVLPWADIQARLDAGWPTRVGLV